MAKRKPDRHCPRPVKSPLHIGERWFYFGTTVFTVGYICYCVYRDSLEYDGILNLYDFGPGWSIIGREQDISNFEWHFWYGMFWRIMPWFIGHSALGKLLELNNAIQWRKSAFLLFSMVALCRLIGWLPICLYTSHALVLFLVTQTQIVLLIWAVSLALLTTLNFEPFLSTMKAMVEPDEDDTWYYLLLFTVALANIRATSFCLEKTWQARHQAGTALRHQAVALIEDTDQQPQGDHMYNKADQDHTTPQAIKFGFTDLLCYIFYLPLFFTGPILTYDLFMTQMNTPPPPNTVSRFTYQSLNILRYIFWAIFNEFLLHFLYFNSLQQNATALSSVSLFTLSGIGYLEGQFFMSKYTVMFGLPGAVARLDNLDPPGGPKCIAYIYLYSDMWKYFDRGLYRFLTRYIYVPCGGSHLGTHRQILGSVLCFMYIFYWHGAEYYIFVWVILNLLGISLEKIESALANTALVKHIQVDYLSAAMVQRIQAIFAIPVFFTSCISMFYFFGGEVVGFVFFQRLIVKGSLASWLTLTGLFYCVLQNAIETNRWLARQHKQKQR